MIVFLPFLLFLSFSSPIFILFSFLNKKGKIKNKKKKKVLLSFMIIFLLLLHIAKGLWLEEGELGAPGWFIKWLNDWLLKLTSFAIVKLFCDRSWFIVGGGGFAAWNGLQVTASVNGLPPIGKAINK